MDFAIFEMILFLRKTQLLWQNSRKAYKKQNLSKNLISENTFVLKYFEAKSDLSQQSYFCSCRKSTL